MLQIVTTPNPILVSPSEEVKHFDKKLHDLIHEMTKTLAATTDPKGVGLAAPQIGISKRLFLAKPSDSAKLLVCINPSVTLIPDPETKTKRKSKLLEGCLSIPTIWGKVARNKKVKVTYQDQHGKTFTKTFSGFLATIVQHEVDHLDGILFTKRVMEQGEKLFRTYKNDKGEDEFEELKI